MTTNPTGGSRVLESLLRWLTGAAAGEATPGPFAPRVDLDEGGFRRAATPSLPRPGARVVVAHGDDARGSVVFEDVCDITGLGQRHAWVYSVTAGAIDRIVVTRMTIPDPAGSGAPFAAEDPEYLATTFGYRRYAPAEADAGMSLADAEGLVEEHVGRPLRGDSDENAASVSYDRSSVLVSDETYFVPFGWVGCTGHLVDRTTRRVLPLGSGISVDDHLWAWHRGVREQEPSSRYDLEILAVHDMVELRRVLREAIRPRHFAAEVESKLTHPPCRFTSLDLLRVVPLLRRAEMSGWFRFRIHRSVGV